MKTTKHTLLHGTLLLGALSCLVGCPDDEKPSSNPASRDMTMASDMMTMGDMAADMADAGGEETPDMMPGDMQEDMACVPKTSCDPDACGAQEDGCGGGLDCGACACVEGEPVEPSCGVCDLGMTRCEEDVTSKSAVSCDYPGGEEALGMVKSCASIRYVNLDAPAGGDGTRAKPFKTYAEALATFRSEEEGVILLTTGFYQEPLIVRSGIHVVGGFQAGDERWVEDPRPQRQTVFNAPVVQGGPTIGMIAHDVSELTLVYKVLAQALDTAPGQSSYGAHLQNSPGLVVDSSRITAGRAGDGADGVDGVDGADGGDGQPPTCMLVDVGQRASFGGSGGVNLSCPEANGGKGGVGAYYTSALGRVAATDGAPSADGTVAGGTAGLTGSTQGNATAGDGSDAPLLVREGSDGEGGKAGGMIVDGDWVSTGQGSDGEDGPHGAGGGGGGGAGSNLQRPQEIGGGGGAAGGCGGQGGTGGGAGGASIGLLALNSNATFRNTQIWGGSGGRGGRGARGGAGGFSGSSGSGSGTDCSGVLRNWRSGHGGSGTSGRRGGEGGGGAGGDSYGAYCIESTLSIDNMTIRAGQGGSGGVGGVPTNEGEEGKSVVHVDCVEGEMP